MKNFPEILKAARKGVGGVHTISKRRTAKPAGEKGHCFTSVCMKER